MTGKENFEPLDELFRKTFQDLPDTPASSGWDVPSSRVWQRVQSEIKPTSTGWTLQTWVLLTVVAVLVAVGLYFAFGKTQPAPSPTPSLIEQPTTLPPAAASTATEEIVPEKATTKPNPKIRSSATEPRPHPAVNNTTPRGEERIQRHAAPLPGTKSAAPNSTEREKGGQ